MTEEEVEAFLTKLKQADSDKKVDVLQFFGLKVEEAGQLPETTLDAIALLVAPLLRSTSHLLVTSTLTSFLPIYLPLLPLTPIIHLRLAVHQFLPSLLDKLNDPKDRTHVPASSCIAILGRKCYDADPTPVGKGKEKETLAGMWERMVKEGMAKGWRGKVEGMKVLLVLRGEAGSRLPLKPWLSTLVELLEDGDGNVRDQARETVVALLSPASTPPAARSELKKLLLARNVRKTIADVIISRIFAGNGNATPHTSAVEAITSAEEGANEKVGTRSSAATPAEEGVDVVYIASGKDLESELAKMVPFFAGKETEHNWAQREKSVVRIRGMLRGQAYQHYPEAFVAGLKNGMIEGIAKTLTSLRTTVAQQSCAVVQELAERLGSAFDPFVENLLPVLGKMAGFTKRIIAEKSQKSLTAIIINTTSHPRLLINHMTTGIGEKNIQTRHYCTSHLKTYLDSNGIRSRHTIDSTNGLLDLMDTAIRKALVDVNVAVRDLARAAYWSFHAVWQQQAAAIMSEMDGVARKQLEKANPHESNGVVPVTAKPSAPRKASSAMSQLLAEKRKAKAAELAAGRTAAESPRVVSLPAPSSPSLQRGSARSTSTFIPAAKRNGSLTRSDSSSNGSPGSPRIPPKAGVKSGLSSPQDHLQRSGSSSLNRDLPSSPNSSLRHTSIPLSEVGSPASSSATSDANTLRTPMLSNKPLPSFFSDPALGIGTSTLPRVPHPSKTTLARTSSSSSVTPGNHILEDALRDQAAQAVSVAEQLLDFTENESKLSGLITPMRLSNGHLLRTPVNGIGANRAWADSPRNEAMTPVMLDKLRERKHERSWWVRRQQLLDKATPLKSSASSISTSIAEDVEALVSGQPDIRNLQKLALFSTSHLISLPSAGDDEDVNEDRRGWEDGRLFERVFDGLMAFLNPTKAPDVLEQALVLLWEMVQHQWIMFEDHEIPLCDALFRLRASRSAIILESTNSLVSLLAEVSDPLFFLGITRDALISYLAQHSVRINEDIVGFTSSNGHTPGQNDIERARASGYLFGLSAMGMCILKLPREVVEVEGGRLASVVTDAMASPTSTTRQAANTLILAIQWVLADRQATLALFAGLNQGQKDLATYLMGRNGLLAGDGNGDKETMMGEMVGLMSRGVAKDQLQAMTGDFLGLHRKPSVRVYGATEGESARAG